MQEANADRNKARKEGRKERKGKERKGKEGKGREGRKEGRKEVSMFASCVAKACLYLVMCRRAFGRP